MAIQVDSWFIFLYENNVSTVMVNNYINTKNNVYRQIIEYKKHHRLEKDETYLIKFTTGRQFSPGFPVSSPNKTDRHDITEILSLITIKQTI
jgi:hypothetical protein